MILTQFLYHLDTNIVNKVKNINEDKDLNTNMYLV